MERTPVVSSHISSIGHDDETRTLEIEFMDGSVYQYFDVPRHVFEAFLAADSAGGFLHREVRGVYRYARA